MIIRILCVIALTVLIVCCSFGFNDPVARKTIGGASKRQVLNVAQHTVSNKGFDIEAVEYSEGILTTIWSDMPNRSVKYEVTVIPAKEAGSNTKGVVTVEVVAKTKDRVVGGWSREYAARLDSKEILEKIIDMVTRQIAENKIDESAQEPEDYDGEEESLPGQTPKPLGTVVPGAPDGGISSSGEVIR